jgi:hypothetical protein
MIELQTSVKQDDTTRTRTPKPGYLNISNEKGWCGPWCRCWSVVIVLIGEQDLSDVASRSCANTHFPPEKTPGYTLSEIGFY